MSDGDLNPRDAIVPLFSVGKESPVEFLGTGSIVGDGSILLTADHVISAWPPDSLRIGVLGRGMFEASVIERDSPHDLALLRIADYRPERPLTVEFDEPVYQNSPLMTYEYGTTVVTGTSMNFNPATRLGHMTRRMDLQDTLGPAGDGAMELSFPALRGASGAPVMFDESAGRLLLGKPGFGIVGVIVANAAYHLLPAQIEAVLSQDNSSYEEVRYLLPQAVAVSVEHLRPMYERAMS
ncbi:serine protease [Mycobacterium sp. 852014-52144_SCH5372336]|uniref:S1 family peptidase n=1 Tax=Mycobacterium sp. 852014-52144_SCH5372336 TaxID=1834115 RepID=UPI0007FC280E|nr:serine protease [Mycobacterium sp. 852014-52144_SCH5372336]OBB77875.1 hypothetical protein A5759_02060 [Mycobacterium sp. 852014-52144_SCH5372336]